MSTENDDSIRDEVRAIWDTNAAFWDERFGEGNAFQRMLVGPATERLLALRPGEWVLDAACGNGAFARRMARQGARVVAFDVSRAFIERARARSAVTADDIDYHVIDAADEEAVAALGEGRFDAVVCGMALMDMPLIEPLFRAARRVLRPGGRLVFTLTHPCFNTADVCKVVEEVDRGGELVTTHGLKLTRYLTPIAARGVGIVGQPVPHYYFDRPLSVLLGACLAAGFVIDGLEEPSWPPDVQGRTPLSWEYFREFPPVLAVRAARREA